MATEAGSGTDAGGMVKVPDAEIELPAPPFWVKLTVKLAGTARRGR